MPIQREIADYITGLQRSDISNAAVKKIQYLVLDALGIAYYVSRETPWGAILNTYALDQKAEGNAALIGSNITMQASLAAFVNGSNMLGCEMEDTLTHAYLHLGPSTISAALATSQQYELSGEAMITAIYGAYEATAPFGERYGRQMLLKGVHPTAHFACIAATVAVGKLLNLSAQEMENAIGIAVMLSSGGVQAINEGSMTRRLYGGVPAQTGITAVGLARNGFDGPHMALEGSGGLLRTLFDDTEIDLANIATDLGKHDRVLESSFKQYACCHAFHACIDIIEDLHNERRFDLNSITKIDAGIKLISYAHANKQPTNVASAQYSLPYCLATALVNGHVGPREFTPVLLSDPEILHIAQLVETTFPQALQSAPAFPGSVVIHFNDGTYISGSQTTAKGDVCNDKTYHAVIQKFTDMTSTTLSEQDRTHVIQQCETLDQLDNLRTLFLSV